jgi:hypothetical protein
MQEEFDRGSFSVAVQGRLGQAYNEDAFRYFLELEWKRAARVGRPFLLALVGLKDNQSKPGARIDPVLASKLFSNLWLCLRETDIIGWYREDRVAGAVLTQWANPPGSEASVSIRQRVHAVLREGLRLDAARRLQVHVYQLRPKPKNQLSAL